jgi:hypothetical protein
MAVAEEGAPPPIAPELPLLALFAVSPVPPFPVDDPALEDELVLPVEDPPLVDEPVPAEEPEGLAEPLPVVDPGPLVAEETSLPVVVPLLDTPVGVSPGEPLALPLWDCVDWDDGVFGSWFLLPPQLARTKRAMTDVRDRCRFISTSVVEGVAEWQ